MSENENGIHLGREFAEDPSQWLAGQAETYQFKYLLAHADDGVIWGHYDNGQLTLSAELFDQIAVKLRAGTLQQVRLFSPSGELWLWRANGNFAARLIDERDGPVGETLEPERYCLWGTTAVDEKNGFTLLAEGQQGMCHAPPLEFTPGQRPAVFVRHYVSYDEEDQAYISHSRLVDLSYVQEAENVAQA